MPEIEEFVLDYIQREYTLPSGYDIDTFNYVREGFIDSIGMVQFVVDLEDEFGISFSDDELAQPEFQVIGSLIDMIQEKMGH